MIAAILALATAHLPAVDTVRFLACVRQVEGHKWSDAGGAYAITAKTWRQHSRLPYRYASDAQHARAVAERHLAWLSGALVVAGLPITPYTLAGSWKLGLEGFKAKSVRGPIDYATRLENLYRSTHALP